MAIYCKVFPDATETGRPQLWISRATLRRVAVVRSPTAAVTTSTVVSPAGTVRCRVAQCQSHDPNVRRVHNSQIEAPDDELADILCLSVAIGVGWVFARVEVAPERVHPHHVRHARRGR